MYIRNIHGRFLREFMYSKSYNKRRLVKFGNLINSFILISILLEPLVLVSKLSNQIYYKIYFQLKKVITFHRAKRTFMEKNRDAKKENKAIQQMFNPLIDIKD